VRLYVGRDSSLWICDLDTELLRLGDDFDSLSRADGVGDLGGEGMVVHEEEVNIVDVVDEEGLVAGRHHVSRLPVGAVTNLWHGSLSLESSSDTIIDTLWFSP